MYLVAIAWMYVVLMMALAEALSPQGSVLGAVITFLFYGVLPLSVVMYLMATPMRRRARLAREAFADAQAAAQAAGQAGVPTGDAARAAPPGDGATALSAAPPDGGGVATSAAPPDGGGHAAGDAVAPVRKEG
jgi:bacteriorhodopsin